MEHPKAGEYFNQYMEHRRKDQAICWDVYPLEQETKQDSVGDSVILIDIGGNMGHQCAEFKRHFPNVKGRIVLQDLPGPISMALSIEGVENQVYDMFTPQPIKGMFSPS